MSGLYMMVTITSRKHMPAFKKITGKTRGRFEPFPLEWEPHPVPSWIIWDWKMMRKASVSIL